MTIVQMREARAKLVADARAIQDGADAAKRSVTAEELVSQQKMLSDIKDLDTRIGVAEDLDKAVRFTGAPESQGGAAVQSKDDFAAAQREARQAYIRDGVQGLTHEQSQILRSSFATLGSEEKRALSAVGGAAGGFTVAPDTSFFGQVMSAMKFFGGIEAAGAEVLNTDTGADLPFITNDDTANTGSIIGESASHANGTDVTFGVKKLGAYLYSTKIILVPWQLLQDASIDIEAFLAAKFAERLGRIRNTHFTTGTGVGQPEGLVTAISVGRQAATGNTTSVPMDDLLRLEHSIDPAYRGMPSVGYMMSDATALAVRLLKDGQGRYMWQDSLQAGAPARLNGYSVTINNDMAALAASAKPIAFGAFSHYKIRNVRGFSFVRLSELYAANGQVGFMAFLRSDGGLIDASGGAVKAFQNSAS
jgi:HK97 family phage major capsid protein